MGYRLKFRLYVVACLFFTACSVPTTVTGIASPSATAKSECSYRSGANGEPLPDPVCTPGATNPDVNQSNIGSTICKSGWTATIRPPVSITGPLKQSLMTKYHTVDPSSRVELDHLISLELGGAPSDIRNLWPEPPDPNSNGTGVNNNKDPVENAARRAVCDGRITLRQAQESISKDWVDFGVQLGVIK